MQHHIAPPPPHEFNESIHSPHHPRWVNSLIGVFPLGNERNERNDEPVTYATASRIDEGGEIVAASRGGQHRGSPRNPLGATWWAPENTTRATRSAEGECHHQ